MKTKLITTIMITLFLASIMAITIPIRADGTVKVAHLGDDGWIMGDTRYNGIVDFVVGPGTPPLGIGSLRLATTNNNPDKAGVAKLGNFGSISGISGSYQWYRTSSTNGFQAPAFKLCVDTDGDGSVNIIVVYEPYFQDGFQSSASDFVWKQGSFAMDNGKWWLWIVGSGAVGQSYADVKTLSEWLADETYGQALSNGNIVALLFEVGSWNANTDGYVDAFYISLLGYTTDFDAPLYWFKASGGGVSYSDASGTSGDYCTIGVIGMSLETSEGIGDRVPCKGNGTFVDHELKIKISFNIKDGAIVRSDNLIYFWGTANVFDIENHIKSYDVPFRLGLVDDQYGITNRFDVQCKGYYWHGILLPDSEVTVWVWE